MFLLGSDSVRLGLKRNGQEFGQLSVSKTAGCKTPAFSPKSALREVLMADFMLSERPRQLAKIAPNESRTTIIDAVDALVFSMHGFEGRFGNVRHLARRLA